MLELLLASVVFASPQEGQSHKECIETISSALEASGEPATVVAQATISACVTLEVKPTASNVLGSMTLEDRKEVIETYRAAYERRIVLKIVRMRACRKTPGCSLAALPKAV